MKVTIPALMADSAPAHEATVVVIDAARADVATLLGSVDAALASEIADLKVVVALGAGDSRRAALEALCAADPRFSFTDEPAVGTGNLVRMPARARPGPRTLPAIIKAAHADDLSQVEVRLPGRPGGKLVLTRGETGGRRSLKAGEVGLRTTSSRREVPPPPEGTLAQERAEHLRHRARGATMRARVDRGQNRLSRERLQVRHERARLRAAEERLGATGAGEWVRWRSRAVSRRVAAVPSRVAAVGNQARNYARRAQRYAADRIRSR